ncbi:MAG: hypothetical protein Q4D29_06205 [Lachnospiraceae bacterium]|nr:hypothetical protein [Lachnospiraceae bacterium]
MRNSHLIRLKKCLRKENIRYYGGLIFSDEDSEIIFPLCLSKVPAAIFRALVNKSGKICFTVKLGVSENDYVRNRLYPVLNELNNKYSFVSLFIDKKDGIFCELQFIIDEDTSDDIICEYIHAMLSITNESASAISRILLEEPAKINEVESPDMCEEFADEEDVDYNESDDYYGEDVDYNESDDYYEEDTNSNVVDEDYILSDLADLSDLLETEDTSEINEESETDETSEFEDLFLENDLFLDDEDNSSSDDTDADVA